MRLRGWISSYPNEAFWQGFRACQPRGGRAALEGFDGCCFLSRWHVPSTVPGPHLRHLAVFTTTLTDGYPFPTEQTETQPKSLSGRYMSSRWQSWGWIPGLGDPGPESAATSQHSLPGKRTPPPFCTDRGPSFLPSGCRMLSSSSSPGWRGRTPRPGPPPTSAAAPAHIPATLR